MWFMHFTLCESQLQKEEIAIFALIWSLHVVNARLGFMSSSLESADGYLPPGTHEATLDELRPLVCFNSHRQSLWLGMVSFLAWPVLAPHFSCAYIGGGFISTKPYPRDVDVVLETKAKFGPEVFQALERFFMAGLENIREIYSVDLRFWIEGAPGGMPDFRVFFQYERKDNPVRPLSRQRGIVKIDLASIEMRSQIRKHLSVSIAG